MAILLAVAACTTFHSALAAVGALQSEGPTRALGRFKAAPVVPLEEGFTNPPAIARVQCWWQLPGSAVTRQEVTRELAEFKVRGMGGVTLKDTTEMPRDEPTAQLKDIPFMSHAWLDMFAHIVTECGRLGLICRSRSSSGWNEGGPGFLWPSPPRRWPLPSPRRCVAQRSSRALYRETGKANRRPPCLRAPIWSCSRWTPQAR